MLFGKRLIKSLAGLALMGGAILVGADSVCAQDYYANAPQLFANQYTQGPMNQATAQMYVAPVPVPEWAGHTYYTYQPLYPHEMLHVHADRYHSYYDNGRGLNSTRVHYGPSIKNMVRGVLGPYIARP